MNYPVLSERPPFPRVFDNTMLADGSDCPMKVKYKFFQHLRPNYANANLHAGGAFAKGIEAVRKAYYTRSSTRKEHADVEGTRALIQAYGDFDPGESVKTSERMVGALGSYLTQYDPANDHVKPLILPNGEPAVEFSFASPVDVLHPETNEPIIYCGRFDMLGVLNENEAALFVTDEKTTKQLGPTWPKQWTLRSQFMGYTWGARNYGYPVIGAIVRGISILKNSYGHAEAIVYFTDAQIARWYEQICLKLEDLILQWKSDKWRYNFNSACSSYGGCDFRMLCESDDPQQWLDPYYRVEVWDPLKLKEVSE